MTSESRDAAVQHLGPGGLSCTWPGDRRGGALLWVDLVYFLLFKEMVQGVLLEDGGLSLSA